MKSVADNGLEDEEEEEVEELPEGTVATRTPRRPRTPRNKDAPVYGDAEPDLWATAIYSLRSVCFQLELQLDQLITTLFKQVIRKHTLLDLSADVIAPIFQGLRQKRFEVFVFQPRAFVSMLSLIF